MADVALGVPASPFPSRPALSTAVLNALQLIAVPVAAGQQDGIWTSAWEGFIRVPCSEQQKAGELLAAGWAQPGLPPRTPWGETGGSQAKDPVQGFLRPRKELALGEPVGEGDQETCFCPDSLSFPFGPQFPYLY